MDTIRQNQAIGMGHGNCDSSIEAGLQNHCAVLSGEDSKKFRVRVLASETEIYKKYFRKDIAKKISKLQIIAAVVIIISQIGTMCFRRYSSSLESIGMGIWASCFTFLAAAFVLWTCKKITYLRLHLSMACHILSVVGCIFLLTSSLGESIPSLRYRLYDSYSSQDNNYNSNNYDYNSYAQMNDPAYNSSTVYHRYPYNYNNNNYYYNRRYSEYGPVGLLVVSFILTTVMAVLGLIQLLLSIVMSVMTIRAMCSGRSNMEGKMFAMEIAGREDSVISMIIPQKQSKLDNGNKRNIYIPSPNGIAASASSGTLPPPYDKILLGHSDAASVA